VIIKYEFGDMISMIENNLSNKSSNILLMAQGCNCFCTQGGGLAGQLRKYKQVYRADIEHGRSGDYDKLGGYSTAIISSNVVMLNMYTQYNYGTETRHVNYAAIALAFKSVNDNLSGKGHTMYIPKIGAGLAGGDWDIISTIINDATPDLHIVVIDYVNGIDPRINV
jgi:O-acetyl-ADP-ribose deacetylase (regulator of RNase III)